MQRASAKSPSGHADAVIYVEKRRTYVLERVEESPALPGRERFLITLRAYPSR